MIDRNWGKEYIGEMVAFCAGLVFALGLGISGMLRPGKVIAFLDIFGDWDYSLALVMIGAILVAFVGLSWAHQQDHALNGAAFPPEPRSQISKRLIVGAVLFGCGWGLSGFCPGPAVVSLVTLSLKPIVFVLAMLIGMVVIDLAFPKK